LLEPGEDGDLVLESKTNRQITEGWFKNIEDRHERKSNKMKACPHCRKFFNARGLQGHIRFVHEKKGRKK
jgi:hypothetical protein